MVLDRVHQFAQPQVYAPNSLAKPEEKDAQEERSSTRFTPQNCVVECGDEYHVRFFNATVMTRTHSQKLASCSCVAIACFLAFAHQKARNAIAMLQFRREHTETSDLAFGRGNTLQR